MPDRVAAHVAGQEGNEVRLCQGASGVSLEDIRKRLLLILRNERRGKALCPNEPNPVRKSLQIVTSCDAEAVHLAPLVPRARADDAESQKQRLHLLHERFVARAE